MKQIRLLVMSFVAFYSMPTLAQTNSYDAVVAGKSCSESSTQTISCEYRVGDTLYFSIDGIGDPDTGITFVKSDMDGDYYATFGVGHGCVIVKPGFRDEEFPFERGYAFVSPRNGKVYRTWPECAGAY